MEISTQAWPLTAFIENISQLSELNNSPLESGEFSYAINTPSGKINGQVYLHPQMEIGLICLKGQLGEELNLRFNCEADLFVSTYAIAGHISLSKLEGKNRAIDNLKSHCFNLRQAQSFQLDFTATINFNMAILVCTHHSLQELQKNTARNDQDEATNQNDLSAIPASGITYRYNLQLLNILHDLEKSNYTHKARMVFIQAQLSLLLAVHYEQFENKQDDNEIEASLNRRDLETIMRAINIIKNELGQNIKVQELTERLGTNENKIQEGFRLITGLTVKQYILEQRLQRAKHMLTQSDLSISEIVYRIGLTNRGYFSKIFKERFDTSPRVYRKGQTG